MKRKLNIKRVLVAGVAVNFASLILEPVSYYYFNWIFFLEPQDVWKWKPGQAIMSMPMGWLVFLLLGNLVLAIIVALVYAILYRGIPGRGIQKGLTFGFLGWLIGVLVPMFSMYILLKIAGGTIVYFTLQGLVEYLVYGIIISAIYREKGLINENEG